MGTPPPLSTSITHQHTPTAIKIPAEKANKLVIVLLLLPDDDAGGVPVISGDT